jgi:hypothetical protein
MNIYILDSDPQKIPALLADDDLSKMIEDVAQVLCNVHQLIKQKALNAYNIPANRSLFRDEKYDALRQAIDDIPLKASGLCEFFDWAKTCAANYGYLVKLGLACCKEFYYRFNSERKDAEIVTVTAHPMQKIIEWCDENRPDLPKSQDREHWCPNNFECKICLGEEITPFPFIMPDETGCWIGEYRKQYARTLKGKEFTFTRRDVPEFLK